MVIYLKNMKNKPIIFVDFDGTICFDFYWCSLPQDLHQKTEELIFGKDNKLVNDWMRGLYTAEEINKILADKFSVPFEYIWKIFVKDCKEMKVSIATLNTINLLREKYIMILSTGNMDSFTRFTSPALKLENYFDEVYNSFDHKRFKTDDDGKMFLELAKKYNVSIQDCVVVDNSKHICEVFGNLGGKVCFVTKEEDVDFHLDKQ